MILRCQLCKTRAAIIVMGRKKTPGVRVCAHCDRATDWPVHLRWKGKRT